MRSQHAEPAVCPIGAKIHARYKPVAQEERQDVIAVLAFVRWRVDLEPEAEAEQALGPGPLPYQGIEGGQEGSGLHASCDAALGQDIGGLAPALHLDRQELARLDQLREALARIRYIEAIIVPEIALGRHAQRSRRNAQKLALRFLRGRCRQSQQLRWKHPLRQIVEPLEAAPGSGRDLARPEQELERSLAVAPAPPGALAAPAIGQLRGADGPAGPDLRQGRLHEAAALETEAGDIGPWPHTAPSALHAPAQERVLRQREERGFVAPILEECSIPSSIGQPVEEVALVGTQAGEEREVMRADEDIDGVDLQEAQALDRAADMARIGRPGRPLLG